MSKTKVFQVSQNDPDNTPNDSSEKPRKLIPAYRDTFVHFLFGSPGNEPILLHLLNAVLESDGQAPAKSVEMRNPFNPQTFVTEKHTVLDVKATDEQGDFFMVEVQTTDQTAFGDRMTYYTCRTFGGQLFSGNTYSMLKRVIGIAITTFVMFRQLRAIHNKFLLAAKADPSVVLTDRVQMHTLEVTAEKIDLVIELPPALGAWINFFFYSHLISEDDMSTLLKDQPLVQRAYEKFKQFNRDEKLRALDESRERFLHDYATDMEVSKAKGVAEGEVKGKVLAILEVRFNKVPQEIEKVIRSMVDLIALESLVEHAKTCKSLGEFGEALM